MTFNYYVPTRLLFGAGQLENLSTQAMPGKKAMIVVSNGKSTKENGYLKRLQEQFVKAGIQYEVFDKIQANPLKSTVMEGAAKVRETDCDFIAALGGGSVMDASKAIAMMSVNDGDLWDYVSGGSQASYAIRFAAGFDGIMMVLSGMSNMEQMIDNIGFMKDFKPLEDKELDAIHKVCEIFRAQDLIPCTACRYCIDECPQKISIPDLFACMNTKKRYNDWNANYYYDNVYTVNNGKASDCIKCGKCEGVCPQHLEIREILKDVAKTFE